jgi:DNA replication protein DnaC
VREGDRAAGQWHPNRALADLHHGQSEHARQPACACCRVLTEREEKNSVAIASNESFGGWTKTFTDPRLCGAIVDRLTFGRNIIETGTDSYRLAQTRARRQTATA